MYEITLFISVTAITLVGGFYLGIFSKGLDRKIAAQFQSRIGPPLRQGFWDLKKLMVKQTIIPENSIRWIFKGAPLVSLTASAMLLVYVLVPYFYFLMGLKSPVFAYMGDFILIIYLLMIPAVAIVAGGFAAGSPLSTIGSQREMVILMATELPLAVTVVAIATRMTQLAPEMPAFNLFTSSSNPLWTGMGPTGILGGILLASTFLFIIPAENGKIPFDQAEAETEIAEGLLVEYSGKHLAFFQLSEAFKSLGVTALAVILFWPQKLSAITGTISAGGVDLTLPCEILFLLFKMSLIFTVSISIVRISVARLKITQAADFMIYSVTALGITGFVLIMLDPSLRAM